LSFRTPEQEQGVPQGVRGSGDGNGQKVAAFEIGTGNPVGVPGRNKGGASHPAAEREERAGEQEDARPAYKYKSVALEPIIENVEYASVGLRTAHCYGHLITS
jgi:hypothetical protein